MFSLSRNKVSHKIDFKAVWTHEVPELPWQPHSRVHADNVGVFCYNYLLFCKNLFSAFLHKISTWYRIRNTHQINIKKVSWVWTAASSCTIINELGLANALSVVISKVHKLSIICVILHPNWLKFGYKFDSKRNSSTFISISKCL